MNRRSGVGRVAAAAAVVAALLCPAQAALAASVPATCATSQLQPVPGIGQKLAGSVPVVFVHGINSSAAMWDVTSGVSIAGQAALIKGVTAWTFDYAHQSLEWVTNKPIGPAFAVSIACLEQASGHKVIVVAHSMGGLATQYAIGYPGSPAVGDVGELITIGTPYQGSPLLSAMQAVVGGSETGSLLGGDAGYVVFAEALLSACAGVATHTNSNPCSLVSVMRSPVGTALEEHSPDINGLPPWPTDLPVLDTAGDIRKIQVFTGSLTFSQGIGDGVVSLASASAHDTTGEPVVEHCTTETIGQLVHNPGGCFHTHLPNDPAIMNAVLGGIRADVKEEMSVAGAPVGVPTTPTAANTYLVQGQDVNRAPLHRPSCRPGCVLSGDASTVLKDTSWSVWSDTEAVGTGFLSLETCTPNCGSGGTYPPIPVVITLSHPVHDCLAQYGSGTTVLGGVRYFWTQVNWAYPKGLPTALHGANAPLNPWVWTGIADQANQSCNSQG